MLTVDEITYEDYTGWAGNGRYLQFIKDKSDCLVGALLTIDRGLLIQPLEKYTFVAAIKEIPDGVPYSEDEDVGIGVITAHTIEEFVDYHNTVANYIKETSNVLQN
jgi:hypothetical protein